MCGGQSLEAFGYPQGLTYDFFSVVRSRAEGPHGRLPLFQRGSTSHFYSTCLFLLPSFLQHWEQLLLPLFLVCLSHWCLTPGGQVPHLIRHGRALSAAQDDFVEPMNELLLDGVDKA